jgi:Tfp pilus assembly protein PilP
MKKISIFILISGFLFLSVGTPFLSAQAEKVEKKESGSQIQNELSPQATYNPANRRDPFKDLLAGKEVKEKSPVGGVPQVSIDEVNLIGITKAGGKFTAIVSGPQGFPLFINAGSKFSDGYVVSIAERQVIFRKINDRGIPLIKPKDIIKEISPEER